MNINATIIGQAISFAIFVFFCLKFVWPLLIAAMNERKEKIAAGLQDADKAAGDLELAKEKAAQTLREAKQQAAELSKPISVQHSLLTKQKIKLAQKASVLK